jgi:diguanylate cyclase (GGDEF)-like protein
VAVRTAQLEEANRELEKLANEDGLTRIPNIRHFHACLDGEWRRAVRNAKPLSILLIDVDHFKKFNDRYGHQAGDQCLRRVAGVLKDGMKRVGDVVARYGGEEFIVLLAGADAAGAALVADDLRRGVEALGIIHEDSGAAQVVTISLGCATTLPREGNDSAELIAAADHALYRSKSAGRNQSTSVDLSEVQIDSERWT